MIVRYLPVSTPQSACIVRRWRWCCLALIASGVYFGCVPRSGVFRTGLEVLKRDGFSPLKGKRVGVVTNTTGLDRRFVPVADLVAAASDVTLTAIFGPEHGISGSAEAGVPVGNVIGGGEERRVPIYSLYGKTRRPTREMLAGVDILLFDIQDIGVRTYTYLSTLLEVMRAAAAADIAVVVLDRPSPLGGILLEGPVLEAGRESFVGAHSVPLRHGLTPGEFAKLVDAELKLGVRLQVVKMEGYRRDTAFAATGLPWVAPSPNIPTLQSAVVYAGMVLVEGTNLSEGRGTTRPFQLVGAPWVRSAELVRQLRLEALPGCLLRMAAFTPSFSKFRGQVCHGVEIHVTDATTFRSVLTAVTVLATTRNLHPDALRFDPSRFDRLAGTDRLRLALEEGKPAAEIVAEWEEDLERFRERRRPYLLYE